MTKRDIIRRISEQGGIDEDRVRFILEDFFEIVKSALGEGEPIYIRKFGSFILKQRAQKIARNITQNTAVTIAAHKIPAFKPSLEFTKQVRGQEILVKRKK
ncbi:integration host factor subunit beta [Spirosoma sp. HMF4905]|uniref:Integration host factor subunit beta n=1 Tax=Spirosoma arboris TaxID=2682092 RepID=A0A7K1SFD6_9BACT|nr:HU family DNA-binding protein [Spirosoma arboris]MVM32463.1 integration host factor subunit beta [Spirosoma arboris]